ncbi:hypothetical protein ACUSIJ_28815 [Pseudochelatococcus sp. B33]
MNITNEIVGFFLAVGGAIFGAYKWIESRINRVEEKTDSTRRDLEAHKLHVAREYVSRDGLKDLRDEMKAGFNDVNKRLDRVIERQGGAE